MATHHLSKRALFAQVGYHPHPGQLAVHRSTAPRRVLCTGVRWGKTKCAAMEALAAAMEPRAHSVGWVASCTYELADRVYREIALCVAEHLRHRIITLREHDKRLVLRNLGGGRSEIRAKSADNPVSLLGEGLDWLVIDEAEPGEPAQAHQLPSESQEARGTFLTASSVVLSKSNLRAWPVCGLARLGLAAWNWPGPAVSASTKAAPICL